MATRESVLLGRIRIAASTIGARLFRNQVGQYRLESGRTIRSGLGAGSPDLVGWHSIQVTPEMVGRRVAVFAAIEVKAPGNRATKAQKRWLRAIRLAGGISGVATSEDEARRILSDTIIDL